MKCCETCRFFDPDQDNKDLGDCDWQFSGKTPDAMVYWMRWVYKSQGVHCPCWELKP